MTTVKAPTSAPGSEATRSHATHDHRGSWIPNWAMITTRFMELRKRRGLMIALALVMVAIPVIVLTIRLILHAVDPHTYGPAGGYHVFVILVPHVLYVFGFLVAAALGATAGSIDLTEGMFRHLVVTGRSRLALYLARIPAGLGIVVPLVTIGFAFVCIVCTYGAPLSLSYQGVTVPAQLSQSQFDSWASTHAHQIVNNFPNNFGEGGQPVDPWCLPGATVAPGEAPFANHAVAVPGGSSPSTLCTQAQFEKVAVQIAKQNYRFYARMFLVPSTSLMIDSGLWIELEVIIGFIVALGLSSLIGQRTVAVIIMVVLELIVTPIAANVHLPHLINLQRAVVGLATAHLTPGGLPAGLSGSEPGIYAVSETTTEAIFVIVAWLVTWTALGAWRMARRDA